jgi:isopenicillin N synthase-like dioxygenase
MIETWRKDGIFQIQLNPVQAKALREAFALSRSYFARPHAEKSKHVDDQSFSGYIASGEELTDGIADYSEIFTVTKDLPLTDRRVQRKWPCHGPCPWPDATYASTMKRLMDVLGDSGEKLLRLTSLGLKLRDVNTLNRLTEDGWHHMRILRFPQIDKTNGKGKAGRGIGSHTDYGLLVLAAQDDVGGLFVRPPIKGEKIHNWEKSAAGLHENDEKWTYVPPVENVLTVFPGDMMQFLTNDHLPSTPHKVGLNTRERFAFAYFHEPNFSTVLRPLSEYSTSTSPEQKKIHYGTHFSNMAMRNYPERITAKRVRAENRMALLDTPELSRVIPTTSTPAPAAVKKWVKVRVEGRPTIRCT